MGFFLTFGLTNISHDWSSWMFVGLGGMLLGAFIRHGQQTDSPLVKPSLFANGPNFLLSNLSALLNYAATFAIGYLMSIYLQQVKGTGADLAGLMLITAPAIQTLLSPVAGRLSDRYSPFRLASVGMATCTACLVAFCFVGADTPIPLILAILAFVGVGFAFFASPNTTAIMSMAPREDFGIASSFVAVMRNFGMVMSMAVITIIVNIFLGDSTIEAAPVVDLIDAMRTCFIIFAVVCALGVFTSLNRRSSKK
jgi:MFS family permease